jgi:hypothetical protein
VFDDAGIDFPPDQEFVFQPVPRIEDITARHLSKVPEHLSLAWIVFEAGG